MRHIDKIENLKYLINLKRSPLILYLFLIKNPIYVPFNQSLTRIETSKKINKVSLDVDPCFNVPNFQYRIS